MATVENTVLPCPILNTHSTVLSPSCRLTHLILSVAG